MKQLIIALLLLGTVAANAEPCAPREVAPDRWSRDRLDCSWRGAGRRCEAFPDAQPPIDEYRVVP